MASRLIQIPAQYSVNASLNGNRVIQIRAVAVAETVEAVPFKRGSVDCVLVTRQSGSKLLVAPKKVILSSDMDELLVAKEVAPDLQDLAEARWLLPGEVNSFNQFAGVKPLLRDTALESWANAFHVREEVLQDGKPIQLGLRPPQVGALYATLSHWTTSADPASVVMPTGTGKTETMLALLAHQRLNRLLVIVPTSALRTQLAMKFATWGVLPRAGIITGAALHPVVGILNHRLKSPEEAEAFLRQCNVIVTTMSVAAGCSAEVQAIMTETCSHLFIDEAHHIPAPSWERFREVFLNKPIVQFTATPFRSDRKHVDGKVVYGYPLRKAQAEGYFRPIHFKPVQEYEQAAADEAIARRAIQQLDDDLKNNRDHIVMARANTIVRAEAIIGVYESVAAHHNPILVHSKLTRAEQQKVLVMLEKRQSRIVICVDMLGEGFDLPQLKIAALHDIHKSLAITLQFIGRFTRFQSDIGDATAVANIGSPEVEEMLTDLYAEDADWNHLLRYLSEGATGRQAKKVDFLEGFAEETKTIPLQNIYPKMSTVVYRTKCTRWQPSNLVEAFDDDQLYAGPFINAKRKIALVVTREVTPVPWGAVRDLRNIEWHLYLFHWDDKHNLLFINSSNNDNEHRVLAEAITNEDSLLMKGEVTFRVFHGINRLILLNLGLSHSLSRAVRFTMYAGSDVMQGITDSHVHNKIKTNLFGMGFESGERTSVGCSQRGRVWSYKVAEDIPDWLDWCEGIGEKLLDENISVQQVLENALKPEELLSRPDLVPLAIEWPEKVFAFNEQLVFVTAKGRRVPFFECGLELSHQDKDVPIRFRLALGSTIVEYEIEYSPKGAQYKPIGKDVATFSIGRKEYEAGEWFATYHPTILFERAAFSRDNQLYRVKSSGAAFDAGRIDTWDWTGTDIRKESQTAAKFSDAIQYRVIQTLLNSASPSYSVIFDDDGPNEVADVVVTFPPNPFN